MGTKDTVCGKGSVEQAFHTYMKYYFEKRDLPATLSMLNPGITGCGTGADEHFEEFEQVKDLYRRDLEQCPEAIAATYHKLQIKPMGDRMGLVYAEMDIASQIDGQPFELKDLRLTLIFVQCEEGWKLDHKQISLPTREHESGESYPVAELEARNRQLEDMVEKKVQQLIDKNRELETALEHVKRLSGMLPICSSCKKVRDDAGYWHRVEVYIRDHSEAQFSHGICPDCARKLYPGYGGEARKETT